VSALNAATFARHSAAAAALIALSACASAPPLPAAPSRLAVRAPKLPLTETIPAPSLPKDPVQKGLFERINADRAAAGVAPVAWDEAAAKVAGAF
jgi:uncharacterized protein YkwD